VTTASNMAASLASVVVAVVLRFGPQPQDLGPETCGS